MDTIASQASTFFRRAGSKFLDIKSRLRGKAFVCQSLQGAGHPGVCVNSDMMLSCGCRDTDGTGRIADLRETTFEDAFFGRQAESFRRKLAEGKTPTPNCYRCSHLRPVSKREAQRSLEEVNRPFSVMIENTSACNLQCISCRRDTLRSLRKRRMMPLEDVAKLAEEMGSMGVEKISYHHLGEPFLSKRLADELTTIRSHIPDVHIQVSTNGMLVDNDTRRDAALLFDHIQFSLDGIDTCMADRYQRGIDFDKVFENMKQLVAYRDARNLRHPIIVWKYLVFRWNERRPYRLKAIELAREAGVDELWFEPTVSPFYGVPWRTYCGFYRDLGTKDGGLRYVPFRESRATAADLTDHVW